MLNALLLTSALLTTPKVPVVALQPLGDVDPRVVASVADHIRVAFAANVTVLSPQPLPETAYYAPRQRYRAAPLLSYLDRETPAQFTRVIGITSKDISTTKGAVFDWGVFGVASLAGRPGIVSTYRLRAGGATDARFTNRLESIVTHELGHTLGLPHCSSDGCVMNDAEGSIAPVDRSSGHFCDACLARIPDCLPN